jgi:type IV secretion system protein VirB10
MRAILGLILLSLTAVAQQARPANRILEDGSALLAAGTHIPLTVMSTVSSKNAAPGDQVYLRTMVPVAVEGRIIIPPGAYVQGTITESRRPGKVKGKGELSLRFDSLMFGDGRSVDLSGRIGAMDGDNPGRLDRAEGKVTSDGSAGRDAMIVGGAAAGGTAMGHWIGGEGRDAGIGAGAGAAAGAAAVLLTRGPEAVLKKGSSVDLVLSRDVRIANLRTR